MPQDLFPTFTKWLSPRGSRWSSSTVTRWVGRRGPTWRTSTWWPGETRSAQQHSLLRILSVAHRERLELTPLVENLAAEHRGSYRRSLKRLVKRLSSGTPVVEALEQTPDVLSDSAVLAIRFGTQTGTLSSTYQQLLEMRPLDLTSQQASLRHLVFYWVVPIAMLFGVFAFVMLIIAPTFIKISDELGLALPAAFRTLESLFHSLEHYALLWLIVLLMLAWLIFSGPSRRFFRRALAARLFRPVAQLRSIELLRLFASAVEAGRPLPGAVSTLARYHFDQHMRQKLLYARNEVEQGVDIWTSLADARLLSANESHALANSSSNEIRSWTLRHLADWKLSLLNRRGAVALALLHPVLVLLVASAVLLVCYATFGFLTHLTLSLS